MKRIYYVIGLSLLSSCVKPPKGVDNSNFPPDVQIIMTNKCATAGCHNDKSYQNAGNLNLTSWTSLFQGGVTGSVAIPHAVGQSPLFSFVNTYADLGVISLPSMPINQANLSREEVIAIKNWIQKGCPSAKGDFPFANDPVSRGKAYITNQGCDIVSVVDAETQLVMRYVKVGHDDLLPEAPHNIKVSADGKYWYVCFSAGSYFQKFDAISDELIAEVNISAGAWNVIKLSSDGNTAYISDLSNNGRIAEVNTLTMSVNKTYGSGLFSNPHGIALNQANNTLYITAQYGNMIYKFNPLIPQLDQISLEKGKAAVLTPKLLDPHEVMMSTDFTSYYITCQSSNELRVMDVATDTMIKAIPLGNTPLEMAISKKKDLLFITCQEDPNPSFPFFLGSVYVVDLKTYQIVHVIREKFYQPHGIALDEKRDLLYVVSRNANLNGPAPHHTSDCGGRNGFYHVIDINTFKPVRPASEISVDPYSADFRNP